MAGAQSFDIDGGAVTATSVEIVMKGTGSGAPGFKLLDARVIGDMVDNPTDTFYVSRAECRGAARKLPGRVAWGEADSGMVFSLRY